ncbi:hypothetical protein [Methanocella arvoryzae]|uniref:hypothetical protein n=1 Tax=Methanocella arvoryzae TaxID=1175445 RepID=UPI0011D1A86C|nr:hypothetical protein [Methanocella arvoryzae]
MQYSYEANTNNQRYSGHWSFPAAGAPVAGSGLQAGYRVFIMSLSPSSRLIPGLLQERMVTQAWASLMAETTLIRMLVSRLGNRLEL